MIERRKDAVRCVIVAMAFASVGVAMADAANAADIKRFTFGLWGDMPYAKANDGPKIAPLIADINASDIAFSMYDGDIKDGSSKCDDASYTEAIKMFDDLKKPAIYVPGDNEWTDCHRKNNGGYDNLERLAHLRKVAFASPKSFGRKKMTLVQQGKPGEKFSENSRFVHDGIVFVGLNIPGSNNNKVGDKDCADDKSARAGPVRRRQCRICGARRRQHRLDARSVRTRQEGQIAGHRAGGAGRSRLRCA